MTKVKNETGGSRAIHILGGEALFASGEERDVKFAPGGITAARMIGMTVDGEEPDSGAAGVAIAAGDAVAALQTERDTLLARVAELEAASSKPKLPGLTGKSKADLIAIAAAENVPDVTDAMTVNDIVSAIELHREANA